MSYIRSKNITDRKNTSYTLLKGLYGLHLPPPPPKNSYTFSKSCSIYHHGVGAVRLWGR
ncbi:MAG: hypothetical protein GDA51_12575 [Ekhidna sp.]|nr:hypothetical protein [Ekhidna sp.]